MVAENFKFSGTVFRCIFIMIRGENISHFEFLGPHVVISKVKIWPIFVVWKNNSKIHVSRSKFEKLSFFKKFLRDQSHFFTQSSGINFSWNHQKKSKNYRQKKRRPPGPHFSSVEFLGGIFFPKCCFRNGILKIGPNPAPKPLKGVCRG